MRAERHPWALHPPWGSHKLCSPLEGPPQGQVLAKPPCPPQGAGDSAWLCSHRQGTAGPRVPPGRPAGWKLPVVAAVPHCTARREPGQPSPAQQQLEETVPRPRFPRPAQKIWEERGAASPSYLVRDLATPCSPHTPRRRTRETSWLPFLGCGRLPSLRAGVWPEEPSSSACRPQRGPWKGQRQQPGLVASGGLVALESSCPTRTRPGAGDSPGFLCLAREKPTRRPPQPPPPVLLGGPGKPSVAFKGASRCP